MSTQPEQSFQNHAQMVPGFHYVTGLAGIVFLFWTVWRLISFRSADALYATFGAVALIGTFWYTRSFPLKAQDRVIRLEEQLRMQKLLTEPLRSQSSVLSARQLIALRFASDAELPELVSWVLKDNVTSGKLIKARITSWRADHHRV
jgi:Family of unknown function (DUF6526)